MIAAWYLRDHEEVDVPVRFDVIQLLVINGDKALVRHYYSAFSESL